MSFPKFLEGERAILLRSNKPGHQSEVVIRRIIYIDGDVLSSPEAPAYKGFAYRLEGLSDDRAVLEPSLRKIHEPSTLSFEELVESCRHGFTRDDLRQSGI